MTTVYLIRHGITDSNVNRRIQGSSDIPLNEQGFSQARLLAQRFTGMPLDRIYASPLMRAQQTAEPISRAKGIPVATVDGLKELHCGLLEGKTYAENEALFPEQMAYFKNNFAKFSPPQGESAQELYWRMMAAMQDIVANNRGKTLVVVSHGLAMQTYLAFLQGRSENELVWYPLENTSVTTILYEGDALGRIVSLNDVSHLAADQ